MQSVDMLSLTVRARILYTRVTAPLDNSTNTNEKYT